MSCQFITCKVCNETYDGFQFDYCPLCDEREYNEAICQVRDKEEINNKLKQEKIAAELEETINGLSLEDKESIVRLLQLCQAGHCSCRRAADEIIKAIAGNDPDTPLTPQLRKSLADVFTRLYKVCLEV